MRRRISSVFCAVVLVSCFSWRETVSQETKGQKAHFSLKDTPGSFTVHATMILAKVSSQADSVKVSVKPGMAEYPLLKDSPTEKPLVHVSPAIIQPQGGWNFISHGRKRSGIVNKNTNKATKTRKHSGTSKSPNLPSNVRFSGSKETRLKRDVNGASTTNRSTKDKLGLTAPNIKSSSKRSVNERKMTFSGGTGKLSVHVDRNETKVLSLTGALKVFINNPWK